MSETIFTADHHGYYRDGSPFFPRIQEDAHPLMEWSNVVCIRLPAHLCDDLHWSQQKEQAHQIIASGKAILWEIDLGLSSFTFTPENSAAFFSFSVALEEFSAAVLPAFKSQTFGVALYRGEVPSETNFPMADWEAAYLEWPSYDLFCAQMLSEYIHRLVSFLPDSVLAFAFVDVSSISSPGKIAQLFSKARFEHVQVILKGAGETEQETATAKLGIYLPKDALVDAPLIQELDKLMIQLKEKGTAYRIIPEDKLTEQWDGIDTLIVPQQAISSQGKRKLLGFAAAGGNILSFERILPSAAIAADGADALEPW